MPTDTVSIPTNALNELQQLLSAKDILLANHQHYGLDESHADIANPCAVVFPRSHDDVVAVVNWANKHHIAIVPSGGRTGLSGGCIAAAGELVVSFDKMQRCIDINIADRQLSVEAGLTIEQVQQLASDNHLFYPVDYASKGSAQIGGALATNAGGLRVLKYGMTRNWVAGFKAVTGSGKTLELSRGLVKDNAGFDLKNLIIGSEGCLAMITEVCLQLTVPLAHQQTALLAFHSFIDLQATFFALREVFELSAAEFFCQQAMQSVCQLHDIPSPFHDFTAGSESFYLLLEFDESEANLLLLANTLEPLNNSHSVIVSQSESQQKELWFYREAISSSLNHQAPYKNDIACKLSLFTDWMNDLITAFSAYSDRLSIVWFGHLGDGNVHINVVRPDDMPAQVFSELFTEFDVMVSAICQRYGATISGEHGIGVLKKGLLQYGRSEQEIELYRSIKQVFDPKNILNPGKLL